MYRELVYIENLYILLYNSTKNYLSLTIIQLLTEFKLVELLKTFSFSLSFSTF